MTNFVPTHSLLLIFQIKSCLTCVLSHHYIEYLIFIKHSQWRTHFMFQFRFAFICSFFENTKQYSLTLIRYMMGVKYVYVDDNYNSPDNKNVFIQPSLRYNLEYHI